MSPEAKDPKALGDIDSDPHTHAQRLEAERQAGIRFDSLHPTDEVVDAAEKARRKQAESAFAKPGTHPSTTITNF